MICWYFYGLLPSTWIEECNLGRRLDCFGSFFEIPGCGKELIRWFNNSKKSMRRCSTCGETRNAFLLHPNGSLPHKRFRLLDCWLKTPKLDHNFGATDFSAYRSKNSKAQRLNWSMMNSISSARSSIDVTTLKKEDNPIVSQRHKATPRESKRDSSHLLQLLNFVNRISHVEKECAANWSG